MLFFIYFLVFIGGFVRSFFGPIIFSLVALIVPKKTYPNAASWSSSTWQLSAVLGPALAGFSIAYYGVNTSMLYVLIAVFLSFLLTYFLKTKPILNPKIANELCNEWAQDSNIINTEKMIFYIFKRKNPSFHYPTISTINTSKVNKKRFPLLFRFF